MPGGYRKVPHEREYIEQAKKDADTILALKSKIGKLAEVRNPAGKRTLKECEAVIEKGWPAFLGGGRGLGSNPGPPALSRTIRYFDEGKSISSFKCQGVPALAPGTRKDT